MRASTGVMSNLYYHLSSIHYISSQFVPNSIFTSTSATNRLRRHRHSTPPPTTEYFIPLVQAGMWNHMIALPPDRQIRLIWRWRRIPPLLTSSPTTAPLGMNPSSASKAAVVTAISPSSKTLRLVKVQLIHLYVWIISNTPPPTPPPLTPPLTPTPKLFPPAPPPPNEDDWDAKEDGYLIEYNLVTPLLLSTSLFLCRRSPPLLSVPYPPCYRRHCRLLAHVCVCLSFAATSILVKPPVFSPSPQYLSFCPSRLPPSYLRHASIYSSLWFAPPCNILSLNPHPLPLYISRSSIFLSVYLSIYILSLTFSLLSLSLTVCLYIFLLNILFSWTLTHFLNPYYWTIHYFTILISISHTHYI